MELQCVSTTMYTMRIFYDQSTLDRVMAWCCQVMASNHYLIQCWHRIRIVTFFAHTNGMGFSFIRYHIFMLCIRKIDEIYIYIYDIHQEDIFYIYIFVLGMIGTYQCHVWKLKKNHWSNMASLFTLFFYFIHRGCFITSCFFFTIIGCIHPSS